MEESLRKGLVCRIHGVEVGVERRNRSTGPGRTNKSPGTGQMGWSFSPGALVGEGPDGGGDRVQSGNYYHDT